MLVLEHIRQLSLMHSAPTSNINIMLTLGGVILDAQGVVDGKVRELRAASLDIGPVELVSVVGDDDVGTQLLHMRHELTQAAPPPWTR